MLSGTKAPLSQKGSWLARKGETEGIMYCKGKIMDKMYNPKLVAKAAALRKQMTKQERHLWYGYLREYDVPFYRQKILGHYIADFYCARAKLVVELDGSQHYENAGMQYDAQRTKELSQFGLTVIRIPNNEVDHNFVGVCEYIDACVKRLDGGNGKR